MFVPGFQNVGLRCFRLTKVIIEPSIIIAIAFLLIGSSLQAQTPSEAESLARQGHAALESGDFDTAVEKLNQAHQIEPHNPAIAEDLLLAYIQAHRLNDALTFGEAAVREFAGNAELHHYYGLALFKAGQNDEAAKELRQSEKLAGNSFPIHFDLALVMLAESNYGVAAEELEKALHYKQDDALAHLLLGRAYQNTNRSVEAIEQFRTALRLDPNVPLGHYSLGFAYGSLGKNPEAIAEYQAQLKLTPDNPELQYQLGRTLLESGDASAAITHLQRATELDPRNEDAFYDLGKALVMAGDTAKAEAALRRAIELNPRDPTPHYQLARCLQKSGKSDEAKLEMQKFAELKKTEPQTGGMATGRIH